MSKGTIKLVVIGDSTVGKTCLLMRYKDNIFPSSYTPTVVENYCKEIVIQKQTYSMNLWDTAGQEEYERLRQLSYPGTQIFIIVFDVSSDISFENAFVKWQTDIQQFEKNAINVFVGNKIDKVTQEELKAIRTKNMKVLNAKGRHNHYFECSALTGDGVEELFNQSIKLEIDRRKKRRSFCAII